MTRGFILSVGSSTADGAMAFGQAAKESTVCRHARVGGRPNLRHRALHRQAVSIGNIEIVMYADLLRHRAAGGMHERIAGDNHPAPPRARSTYICTVGRNKTVLIGHLLIGCRADNRFEAQRGRVDMAQLVSCAFHPGCKFDGFDHA